MIECVVVDALVEACILADEASVRLVGGSIMFGVTWPPCDGGVIGTSSLDVVSLVNLGSMHIFDGPIMRGGSLAMSVDLGSLVVSMTL